MRPFAPLIPALAIIALLVPAVPALAAGPTDLATQHIQAVAAGDLGAITGQYAADATLHWVGGPLNGAYAGAQLGEVWGKFTKGQGPLTTAIHDMKENANPAGSTVTADVVFTGKAPIKVHYVLLYRADKLVGEIWQIDPKLAY